MESFIISFVIIFCCFMILNSEKDPMFGPLILFGGIVKSLILSLAIFTLFFICQRFLSQSHFFINHNTFILVTLSLAIGLWVFYKVPFSYEKELKKNQRYVNRKLKKEKAHKPNDIIVSLDTSIVTKRIKALFDTDNSQGIESQEDSVNMNMLYYFFNRRFLRSKKEDHLLYKNHLQPDFVSYSSN